MHPKSYSYHNYFLGYHEHYLDVVLIDSLGHYCLVCYPDRTRSCYRLCCDRLYDRCHNIDLGFDFVHSDPHYGLGSLDRDESGLLRLLGCCSNRPILFLLYHHCRLRRLCPCNHFCHTDPSGGNTDPTLHRVHPRHGSDLSNEICDLLYDLLGHPDRSNHVCFDIVMSIYRLFIHFSFYFVLHCR